VSPFRLIGDVNLRAHRRDEQPFEVRVVGAAFDEEDAQLDPRGLGADVMVTIVDVLKIGLVVILRKVIQNNVLQRSGNLRRGFGDPNVFNRIVEVRVQLSKTNQGENQQGSGDQGQQSREMSTNPFSTSRSARNRSVQRSQPSVPT